MNYGKEIEVQPLDDNGSNVATESRIHEGTVKSNPLKRFEIKVKVRTKEDELTEYIKFQKALESNDRLFSDGTEKHYPCTIREKNKKLDELGYYFIWLCWSERL